MWVYTCTCVGVCIGLTVVVSMLVQGADYLAKIDSREGDGQVESLSSSIFVYSV